MMWRDEGISVFFFTDTENKLTTNRLMENLLDRLARSFTTLATQLLILHVKPANNSRSSDKCPVNFKF